MCRPCCAMAKCGKLAATSTRSGNLFCQWSQPRPVYFVVNCGEDEGKPWISRHQVVAWRIDDDRAIPVTPREDEFGCCDMVLAPDGNVTVPYDRVFDSEAEWAAEITSRRAEEQRREAERRLTVVEGVGEASKGAA